MQMNRKLTRSISLCFIGMLAIHGPLVHAATLKEILKQALVNDPVIQEAQANVSFAHSTMQTTKAEHYPIVSAIGTQVLGQQHKYESNARETHFAPGLRATVNVYAWGGIEAAVDRDKKKEAYYQYTAEQTREDLGYKISALYLTALRTKESLVVAERNLKRHDKMLHDLNIIVQHDSGRLSELAQAQARRLKVETGIAELRRTLGLTVSRLEVYTQDFLAPDTIVDPFYGMASQDFISQYHRAEVDQMPSINLEGTASPDNKEIYLRMSWDIFNQGSKHKISQKNQTKIAVASRMQQSLRDTIERSRTAMFDMSQNEQRVKLVNQYIDVQQKVVWAYEQQFKISRRTLIDVLDAYNELANIEATEVEARNDFRAATLEYLLAQAKISQWAGVTN